jgi:anti-sigma B factor antagonist
MSIMRYDEIDIDGVTLLTLHGDITGDGSRRLIDHVRRLLVEGRRNIVLDVTAIRHVDSRGLGELIECYEAAGDLGGAIKLLGVNGRLSDLLVITKLVNVFECFETRPAAIESFAHPAVLVVAAGR